METKTMKDNPLAGIQEAGSLGGWTLEDKHEALGRITASVEDVRRAIQEVASKDLKSGLAALQTALVELARCYPPELLKSAMESVALEAMGNPILERHLREIE